MMMKKAIIVIIFVVLFFFACDKSVVIDRPTIRGLVETEDAPYTYEETEDEIISPEEMMRRMEEEMRLREEEMERQHEEEMRLMEEQIWEKSNKF